MESEQLIFTKFKPQDFAEYQSWFKDPELNAHLGPMEENDPWLDYILTNNEGVEYSIFNEHQMIAEVGILFPNQQYPSYYITNLAIKPGLRNQGVGSKVLKALINLHPLKGGESWKTAVNANNPKARSFLEKNGWIGLSSTPDDANMYDYEFPRLNLFAQGR